MKFIYSTLAVFCFLWMMNPVSYAQQKANKRTKKEVKTQKHTASPKNVAPATQAKTTTEVEKKDTATSALAAAPITIVSAFTPSLKDFQKLHFSTSAELPPIEKPVFQYSVPVQVLSFDYESSPLSPLGLQTKKTSYYQSLVKAGYGLLRSPYIEVLNKIASGDKWQLSTHDKFMRAKGHLPLQQASVWTSDMQLQLHTLPHHLLKARMTMDRNARYAYAYQQLPNTFPAKDKNELFRRHFNIGLETSVNNTDDFFRLSYAPAVKMNYFHAKNQASEFTVNFQLPVNAAINEHWELGTSVENYWTKSYLPVQRTSNNIFVIDPKVKYSSEWLTASLGATASWDNGVFYALPNIELSKSWWQKTFQTRLGWKGYHTPTTFSSLVAFNPWINMPTVLKNQRTSEVFATADFSFLKYFNVHTKVAYQQIHDLPLFINNTANPSSFDVLYSHKIANTQLSGSLSYNNANLLTALLSVTKNFYGRDEKHLAPYGHIPLIVEADIAWSWHPKWRVQTDVDFTTGTYFLEQSKLSKLGATFDWSLGTTWSPKPQWDIWLLANNILNTPQARWHLYDRFGRNIMLGVTFRFDKK